MHIDIIVPNFDESSDEVILSSWYKKVGDKISKNEIIADAETAQVACGITSSYDCILAKILVKEGEIISQGTKIAIIETDLDSSDHKENISDVEEAKEESEIISEQIKEDQKEQREESEVDLNENQKGYSLSVPLGDSKDKEILEKHIVKELDKTISIEEKIINLEEKVIDDFTERTEEKFKSILKEAEEKAKEEAQKLKENILKDAEKQGKIEAEELKAKILKEYEEKATKDASEMHQKIVQGSLQEAENTRAMLINDAKEKATEEAEMLRAEILKNAEIEAKTKTEETIKEVIFQAQKRAKQEAELLSKQIIETAIDESKQEAKAIKKDIIHSAQKHAAKESENIVKGVINKARKQSYFQAEEMVESAAKLATREAELLKDEIIQSTRSEIKDTVNLTLQSIVKEIYHEMRQSIGEVAKEVKADANAQIKKSAKNILEDVENKGIKEKILIEKTEKLENKIEEQAEVVKKLLNPKGDSAPEMFADNWDKPKYFASPEDQHEPIDPLKRRISEKMKDSYDASVISTVSNEVDMSAVLALEKTFGKTFSSKYDTRLGFTPFFISACIAALKQYRVFNAHIHEDKIIYKNTFDISIITCGNDGVAAPVIRHADSLSIAEIEKAMISLSRRAVEGALSIEEVSGGTFTVVNAGIYGSLIGTDLLTPPQVATLSVHKMHNRPAATDSGIEIKPMLYISLSYDHRISDTKKASEFLSNIKDYVENPGWQILGL
jgi:2-oxoglutarate dehydrogenase E2 component (dihydrolipoamide succinyltransferase)